MAPNEEGTGATTSDLLLLADGEVSLSGGDSGIGGDTAGEPVSGSDDVSDGNEESFSCDCVCSCCCKCRENVPPSPVVAFLSQQYSRLPSLHPPTPPTVTSQLHPLDGILRSSATIIETGSGDGASAQYWARSTSRLDEVSASTAVKRNTDNTMAAVVRRRRRLKRRARSGDFQSLQLLNTLPRDAGHGSNNEDGAESKPVEKASTTRSTSTTVRKLEIKFVW